MPASLPRLLLAAALGLATSGVGAQDAVRATTARPVEVEGQAWYEVAKRQRDRVRLVKGLACADPATSLVPAAEIRATLERYPRFDAPGFVPASRTDTTASAGYPRQQLEAGTPGAAFVMITIDAAGGLQQARVVCATDPAFATQAVEVVGRNRYAPARLDGTPVAAVVFQAVTFGVGED